MGRELTRLHVYAAGYFENAGQAHLLLDVGSKNPELVDGSKKKGEKVRTRDQVRSALLSIIRQIQGIDVHEAEDSDPIDMGNLTQLQAIQLHRELVEEFGDFNPRLMYKLKTLGQAVDLLCEVVGVPIEQEAT